MKLLNAALLSAGLIAGLTVDTAAYAHGGARVGVGVVIGGPVWGPWYYPGPGYYSPYYYPPYPYPYAPAVTSPPRYIEKADDGPGEQSAYWYYCAESKAYYPYVKECPGAWQRVAPQPPSTR